MPPKRKTPPAAAKKAKATPPKASPAAKKATTAAKSKKKLPVKKEKEATNNISKKKATTTTSASKKSEKTTKKKDDVGAKSSSKTYRVHHNFCRPFSVQVKGTPNNKTVTVARFLPKEESGSGRDQYYTSNPVRTIANADQVFIGCDPESTPYDDGNTILVVKGDTATFIGEEVLEFKPAALPIVSFHSPLASNDVPVPYAIDNKGNYYVIGEKKMIVGPIPKPRADADEEYADPFFFKLWDYCASKAKKWLAKVRPLDGMVVVMPFPGRQ